MHYSQPLGVTLPGVVVSPSQTLGGTSAGATRPSGGGAAAESQPSPATGVIHGNKQPKDKNLLSFNLRKISIGKQYSDSSTQTNGKLRK